MIVKEYETWENFKNDMLLNKKEHTLQYEELFSPDRYLLEYYESYYKSCFYSLDKLNNNEVVDFENNFKNEANKLTDLSVLIKNKNYNGYKKYYIKNSFSNLKCSKTEWTLYDTINFDKKIVLDELLISIQNNHNLKVVIDKETILNCSIQDLYLILGNYNLMDSINIKKSGNKYYIKLNLYNVVADEISIYQKKRAGERSVLPISGYILSYIEDF